MRRSVLPLIMLLGACAPATAPVSSFSSGLPQQASTAKPTGLPAMRTFGAPRSVLPQVSNADLARDFLDLHFRLESGRTLPVFTRFEGPITVRVTGRPTETLDEDLARLFYRLRNEAGLNITRTQRRDANIVIQAVSRADIRRAVPQAACFVVPNISSLGEFKRARRAKRTNWSELKTREKLAIFLPNDASPQEARDCLHEELAQALGPLNDLYRLPESVFNDDNVHTILTGYDMLILRVGYDAALRSGMSAQEVAARLPEILTRLNPQGDALPQRNASQTPRAFSEAIQTALGPGASHAQRQAAVDRALRIANSMNWQDHRLAFAHYAAGRLHQSQDPGTAKAHFSQADALYARTPGAELHRAYVAAQLAAHAIADGNGNSALNRINPQIAIATRTENAALLATLLMLKSEALALTGQITEARSVRLDSLAWARYGFGPEWAVRAKAQEIAALNPTGGRG